MNPETDATLRTPPLPRSTMPGRNAPHSATIASTLSRIIWTSLRDRELVEAPAGPHSRVVDQHVHDLPARGDLGRDPVAVGRVGEVRGDPLDADAVLAADLGRHFAQTVGAARHQGERVAAAGEFTGKRDADARRRPGDQRGHGRRCHRLTGPRCSEIRSVSGTALPTQQQLDDKGGAEQ